MSKKRLPIAEFVALMAMLFSMVAFSIDSMLPGLPDIARDLSPDRPNLAQLVVTSFVLGLGLGSTVTGPLSDSFGRRKIVIGGMALFVLGSVLAYLAPTLEVLLLARLLQGLGVAGPRIAPLAMVRDLYEGRRMAQITSFVTTVFMLVPALAPSLGTLIISAGGWRAIFLVFIGFAGIAGTWLLIRQGETLPPERRRRLGVVDLRESFVVVISNKTARIALFALSLEFGALVALLSSTQPIYAQVFDRADSFPLWFAATALVAAVGTILNARLVMGLGMRRLIFWAFAGQMVVSILAAAVFQSGVLTGDSAFFLWFAWSASLLFGVGMIMGNLSALALQPLGHVAGMAASVISALSTIIGVVIAVPIGQAFNGSPLPLIVSVAFLTGAALVLLLRHLPADATGVEPPAFIDNN